MTATTGNDTSASFLDAVATTPETVEIDDGGEFSLHVGHVTKWIDGQPHRMLAYNGSIPGPTLRVKQGSEVGVCEETL